MYFISIGQNVSQHLTYFISIGQHLNKLVNQRTLGVRTDTLINKQTLRVSNKDVMTLQRCQCVNCTVLRRNVQLVLNLSKIKFGT